MKRGLIALAMTLALAGSAFAQGIDIFQAARDGNVEALNAALQEKQDINGHDARGFTPLILAAYNEQQDAVKFLLEKGADPCLGDYKGQTALMGVAFKGDVQIGRMLVDRCDVNARNRVGQTALMFASLFGRTEMMRLLIEKGADPDIADIQGNTAVTLIEGQGHPELKVYLEKNPPAPQQK